MEGLKRLYSEGLIYGEIIQAISEPQWTELKEKVTCAAPEEFLRVTRKSQHVRTRKRKAPEQRILGEENIRPDRRRRKARRSLRKKNLFLEAQTNGGSMGFFKANTSQV